MKRNIISKHPIFFLCITIALAIALHFIFKPSTAQAIDLYLYKNHKPIISCQQLPENFQEFIGLDFSNSVTRLRYLSKDNKRSKVELRPFKGFQAKSKFVILRKNCKVPPLF